MKEKLKEKFLKIFTTEKERVAEIKTVEIQGIIAKSENSSFYLLDENGKKYLFEIPPKNLEIGERLAFKIDLNFSKYGTELKSVYEKLGYFGVIYIN